MKPIHSFIVSANLPDKISKLKELAYNYWWCWNSEARDLFNRVDRDIWDEVDHNPVLLINKVPQEKLIKLAEQRDFTRYLDKVYETFQNYMNAQTWYSKQENAPNEVIAYFSPEYGINESFPNYSGGLGVLAGDHMKSASDLGLPLVGVGLLYQQGYFRQHLTQNGWQNEIYKYNDFFSMPLELMRNEHGEPIIIDVDLPYGKAFAQIWKLAVGRVSIYFLDTNIEMNGIDEYREITNQLYGGTRDTRIQQEILLGIGGMRALKAIGLNPSTIHINEGHAAFALVERTRMYMEEKQMDFFSALQITKGSSVFTTHTPVPAGNESFTMDKMEHYFRNYFPSLGLQQDEFLRFGQTDDFDYNRDFSMTVIGLRFTAYRNGVSKLHGEVSRDMWKNLWKSFPETEIPINGLTNGIHTKTFVSREFEELFDRYLPLGWHTDTDNQKIWNEIDNIPNEEMWREKQRRRVRLILFVRHYLQNKQKNFLLPEQMNKINEYLNPDALTIGFARRFATYKRSALLFSDMERLTSILTNPDRPVQVLISGKAHPHDTAGKEVIQSIIQKIRAAELEKYVIFLEDYDMVIGRLLVKGCDVWLNNPIRPMEASGTSGMKAALNGALNLSVLDGWWDEAYNGTNGFAIGDAEDRDNNDETDYIESQMIYDLLESQVVPMFYDRANTRVPTQWVQFMKNSVKTIAGEFSTHRMVKDYTTRCYIPALNQYKKLITDNNQPAKDLKIWKDKIRSEWQNVEVIDSSIKNDGDSFVGKEIGVSAMVSLGNLPPQDVIVQVYYGSIDHHGMLKDTDFKTLKHVRSEKHFHHYEGAFNCPDTGKQGVTIRILPSHDLMSNTSDLYISSWA